MQPSNWKPCPYCGRPHPASAVVCGKCGRYFATGRLSRTGPPAGVVACPACGNPNYGSRDRCWKCLAPLPAAPPSPPAPPPSPATEAAAEEEVTLSPQPREILREETAASRFPRLSPSSPSPNAAAAPDPAAIARLEQQVAELTAAIEQDRADADTYELRASYLIELRRLDEAEADVEQVADPVQRDLLRADIAAGRGSLREACDLYDAVLAENPGRTSVARKRARLLVQQRTFNPEEVDFVRDTLEQQFDRLAGSPDWVNWVTFLHERYQAAGQWDQEMALLRRVAERNPLPSNPRLAQWMVDALLAQGALDEALSVLSQLPASSRNPSAVQASEHAAAALIRAGRNAEAAVLLRRVDDTGARVRALQISMLEKAGEGQRFVPEERIGAGAVAEVWKAFDLFTGRHVGLKILHPSLTEDPSAKEELRREYQVMSSSLSPRLARTVPDTLTDDRFAMELLDESLVDLLMEPAHAQGLPVFRAVTIAQQVAEGLDYLHARGIVYQDLSPQNILFREDDVKLCDLGGINEGAAPSTASAVAKVAYASPEQCALLMGERTGTVDRRSDIYNLGVVLYQMVTGRLPFEGPDQAVLHAHLYSAPVAPVIHRPEIGLPLSGLILRCMARQPEDRFDTAAELWDALHQIQR